MNKQYKESGLYYIYKMDASLNIVELIENNPITRLTNTYQHKLLTKIKANFSDNEQQMFIASFYCYLKHDARQDFVINLDDVWRWLGFQSKFNAKRLLEKYFRVETDYKLLLRQAAEQSAHIKGGHNKEIFMLNIETFKKFCLKAGTKKADEIHDYYIKLEETLNEVLHEESQELKLQLEQKTTELQQQVLTSDKEKDILREKTILEQFPPNTQCVYYGRIDNLSTNQEQLIKFGNSNDLKQRVKKHKETYLNFRLVNAFKVDNKLQIENAIKAHPVFIARLRSLVIHYKKYVELITLSSSLGGGPPLHTADLTMPELDKIFREIITDLEYSPANYMKILEENKALKKQIEQMQEANHTNQLILTQTDNARLQAENLKLIKKYNTLQKRSSGLADDTPIPTQTQTSTPVKEPTPIQPGQVMPAFKKHIRNKQGTYTIEGQEYQKNEGTRAEVWDGTAYQTSGLMRKQDLIMNKAGKLISKKKNILAALQNHLESYNATR